MSGLVDVLVAGDLVVRPLLDAAGRRRYLLAGLADGRSWTYGAGDAPAEGTGLPGRLLGTGLEAMQLRRGSQPQGAPTAASRVEERDPHDRRVALNRITWPDGTSRDEVLLLLLLMLGADEIKLSPL